MPPPPPPLRLQRQLPRLPRSAPAAPRDGRGTEKGRVRRGRGRGVPTSSHGILGLPGTPPAGRGVVETRGARLGATPPHPLQATAPPMEQWRSGGRDPAPCSALGEGARGVSLAPSLVRSRAVPPTDSAGSLPEARQRVIVTTLGFPGQRGWGGTQST